MYTEGAARIKYAKGAFLNPLARVLRDMSVATVGAVAGKKTSILDPTAATGIRGIRYYLETQSRDVVLLDMNKAAYLDARKNVAFNKAKVKVFNKSIQAFSNTTDQKFDVIDFDPFGSISPSIFDLMKVSKDGTILFFTATDTAVLCGAQQKACMKIYDARPMHNELCHEVGLRIMIGYVARLVTQFNLGMEVLLSFSHEHYMRATVRIKHGAESANETAKSMGYVYYCNGCGFRSMGRSTFPGLISCGLCGSRLDVAGKLWAGPVKDKGFVDTLLDEMVARKFGKDSIKVMSGLKDEAYMPLYYSIPRLTKRMGIPSVSQTTLIERLRAAGFIATRTQFDLDAIKTDANIEEITSEIKLMGK